MRLHTLTLALAALLPNLASATVTAGNNAAGNAVVITITNQTWTGWEFGSFAAGSFQGTLTSVSVSATLEASVDYTYANDLTLYIDPAPLNVGGLLQVGGYNSLSAAERHAWANGSSDAVGTTVSDTVLLTTPLTFTGSASDAIINVGNGYGAAGTSGTWSGTVTLTGIQIVAVPEPATWALFGLGAAGLAAWSARRQRKAA